MAAASKDSDIDLTLEEEDIPAPPPAGAAAAAAAPQPPPVPAAAKPPPKKKRRIALTKVSEAEAARATGRLMGMTQKERFAKEMGAVLGKYVGQTFDEDTMLDLWNEADAAAAHVDSMKRQAIEARRLGLANAEDIAREAKEDAKQAKLLEKVAREYEENYEENYEIQQKSAAARKQSAAARKEPTEETFKVAQTKRMMDLWERADALEVEAEAAAEDSRHAVLAKQGNAKELQEKAKMLAKEFKAAKAVAERFEAAVKREEKAAAPIDLAKAFEEHSKQAEREAGEEAIDGSEEEEDEEEDEEDEEEEWW